MATVQECRDRAKECIDLAMSARSKELRIMLEHIAATWLRLADEALNNSSYVMLTDRSTRRLKAG